MKIRLLSALLSLLVSSGAVAAEGGAVAGYARMEGEAYYLCDGRSATGACATIDFTGRYERNLLVSVLTTTGCSSYTVDIEHRATATSDWHVLGTLSSSGVTAIVVTDRIGAYMRGNITALVGCTDLEIAVEWLR